MDLVFACAKHKAAGLVVCGDKDEGFLGMTGKEFQGKVHGISHIRKFLEGRCGIRAVAGPVYLSALYHHKEAFLAEVLLKVGYTCLHKVRKLGVLLLTVNGIGKVLLGLAAEAEYPTVNVLHAGKIGALEKGNASIGRHLFIILWAALRAFVHNEAGACGKVHRGRYKLGGDILVVLAD